MNDPKNPCGCNEQPVSIDSMTEAQVVAGLFAEVGDDMLNAATTSAASSDGLNRSITISGLGNDTVAAIVAAHKGPKIILL